MPFFRPLSDTKFINDSRLVSYFPLDGNSTDVKGSNTGTDANMSYVAGKFNQAGSFNGANSSIKKASPVGVQNNSYTYNIIVKPSGNYDHTALSIGDSATGDQVIRLTTGGKILAISYCSGGNNSFTGVITIPTTEYSMISLVRDTVSNTIKVYVNAVLDTSQTLTNATALYGTPTLRIGCRANSPSGDYNFFNGLEEEVAIFNAGLSQAELTELYQGLTLGESISAGASTTKLLLHLNGNSSDASGNNNNGVDYNITYPDGKLGKCARFNGANGKIDIASNAGLQFTNNFTHIYLIKLSATGLTNKYICSKGNNYGMIYGYVSQKFEFFANGQSGVDPRTPLTTPINDTNYHIIAWTYDGSTIKGYLDGNLDVSLSKIFTLATGTTALTIGGSGSADWFSGDVDEIRFENRVFSYQEIKMYTAKLLGRLAIL